MPDKKGARLTPSKYGGCPTADTSVPAFGQMTIQPLSLGVRLEGSGVPVSELVRVLAVVLNRPVLDRTNLSGTFDILLKAIDEVPAGGPSDAAGATVFAAFQDQLGLKLEPGKGAVEIPGYRPR